MCCAYISVSGKRSTQTIISHRTIVHIIDRNSYPMPILPSEREHRIPVFFEAPAVLPLVRPVGCQNWYCYSAIGAASITYAFVVPCLDASGILCKSCISNRQIAETRKNYTGLSPATFRRPQRGAYACCIVYPVCVWVLSCF